MDIQLEKKKGLQKKHIPYVAGGVLFVILLGWIIFGDHASTLKVDASFLFHRLSWNYLYYTEKIKRQQYR